MVSHAFYFCIFREMVLQSRQDMEGAIWQHLTNLFPNNLMCSYTHGVLCKRCCKPKQCACFGGDEASTWFGLEQVVFGILSLSSCGFSFWGSDLGGFFGTPSTDIYCRWLEFATFSPLMRAHGIIVAKDPWNFGEKAVAAFKKYFALRESILDTLYSAAVHSHKTGEPMLKALAVAFPGETELFNVGDEYLFCDSLLVAPIIKENITFREVKLPVGNWTDLWTGEVIKGGKTITCDVPQDHIAAFVKENTLLPVSADAGGSLTALCGEKTDIYLITTHTGAKTHTIYFENGKKTFLSVIKTAF